MHTAHRLRHRADGDVAHLVRLADFIRDHPDESHEHTDLADCCRDVRWLSGTPAAAPLPRGIDDVGRLEGDDLAAELGLGDGEGLTGFGPAFDTSELDEINAGFGTAGGSFDDMGGDLGGPARDDK